MRNKKIIPLILIVGLILLSGFVLWTMEKEQKPELTKQQLLQKFQSLKTQYEQAKEQGLDVSEVENLTREAKQSFDRENYTKSKELLDKAFWTLKTVKGSAEPAQNCTTCPAGWIADIDSCSPPCPTGKNCPLSILRCPASIPTSGSNTSLSNVKVAIVYERLNDARPKRTIGEQIQILKDTRAEMIFRASWRWNPQPNSCSEVPPEQKQTCIDSGYSFEDMKKTISEIKKQNPNIIIIGAIPTQKINKNEVNEITGETFNEIQTWAMALDPAKWGISSPTKEELRGRFAGTVSAGNFYPDLTNPQFQDLLLSWAKKQIDSGMDGIWIDLLYTQADMLKGFTGDVNHPAVKESYEAGIKIIDEIHKYGESKGRYIYVGTWDQPAGYMGRIYGAAPNLDFITATPAVNEVSQKQLDEKIWDDKISKAKQAFGEIPFFAFIDWAGKSAQTGVFSQLSIDEQKAFLRTSDEFFKLKGLKFIYPVHGGVTAVMAYGKDYWYDSKAPEFQTYGTIKELAQKKAKGE